MADWYQMPVRAKKIGEKLVRFTVGNDVIEMHVVLSGSDFSDLYIRVVRHYIGSPQNMVTNYNRSLALQSRIEKFLKEKYLEELKNVFCKIAAEPAGKLTKTFTCFGWKFNEYYTTEEIFQ